MNDTQTNLINNNEYDIHFLLDMKKSLERQNSYIFALIDETNEYKSDYEPFLKVKQENTFLLTLQKQKIMNETIINNINMKMLEVCNHELEEDYIETGVESSMTKIRFCNNCQMNM